MTRVSGVVGAVALCVLVVAVRSVGFERVFPADGPAVVLAMDDAQYHARRARYTFENFPGVLSFDPYLNYPEGAVVPWPPLYDFLLGVAGRMAGDLDLVLAWAPVVLGLLTALAVFAIGRIVGGRDNYAFGAFGAFGALTFFALLPASSFYTSVGNPDHHAMVALLATGLLLGNLACLAAGDRVGRVWAWQGMLVAVRLAMLLSWHGSMLYVVLAEGIAVLVASWVGRPEQLLAQGLSCGLAAFGGLAALSLPHSEFAGPWSAVEFSRLQPASYAAVAVVALAAWAIFERWQRQSQTQGRAVKSLKRLAATLLLGAVAAGCVLGLAWESLSPAWAYASGAERFIGMNYEAQPLWRAGLAAASARYGAAALLLPLTPLAGLWLARISADPGPGLFLMGWTAALLVLAISNARYASDFAPAAAVSYALLAAAAARVVAARWSRLRVPALVVAAALLPALLWGPVARLAPQAQRSLAVLRGRAAIVKHPAQGLASSAYAFAESVRAVTPETLDGLDSPGSRQTPEYGIITPSTLGFVVNAVSRRPTPAGNFGPYVGREGIEATNQFYFARDERTALRLGSRLRARYVITSDEGRAPTRLWHRLHHGDGSLSAAAPALGHFRLVTESTRPGVPLGALRGVAPNVVDVPYKLFEIVRGAVLTIPGQPGEAVSAEIAVEAPSGRRFRYRSRATVGPDGHGRIRVPYETGSARPERVDLVARARGLYRVRSGEQSWEVAVRRDEIAEGAGVHVAESAASS